jgi:hypothetical protein
VYGTIDPGATESKRLNLRRGVGRSAAGGGRRVVCAVVVGTALALAIASSTEAASPRATAVPKSCPSASIVSSAFGGKATAPVVTHSTYFTMCVYGSNALAPKVTFQQDTAATFVAGEKAAAAALPVAKISHLGKAAWAPKSGGSVYVFTGSYTIKILAPLTSLAKLETLARKLL